MVVVSNRLPFVLTRKEDGSLERRMRYIRWGFNRIHGRKKTKKILDKNIFLLELKFSSAGGLVTAVAPVVVESQGTWVINQRQSNLNRTDNNGRLVGQACMTSVLQWKRFRSALLEASLDQRTDSSPTVSSRLPSSRERFLRITTTAVATPPSGLCSTACPTGPCSTGRHGLLTRRSTKSLV